MEGLPFDIEDIAEFFRKYGLYILLALVILVTWGLITYFDIRAYT